MNPNAQKPKSLLARVVRFLGSIQLAVPVLVLVAAAMAWGTYLESTQNARVSRATVYGSWWFITLMGLICVSLIFAVITRYPWKRKHVGFITVHTGLVILIAGSFWSMWGRIEGHLTLEEGASGDQIETEREVLELAEFNAGRSTVVGSTAAPMGAASATLGTLDVRVVERWDNCREVHFVADDSREPLRAVEIAGNPTASEGDWVAEEAKAGGAPTLENMTIRVLPDGASWTPPVKPVASATGYVFTIDGSQYPVGDVGSEIFPGWKVREVKKYTNALVSGGRISEGGPEKNPAVEVTIADGKGTVERHTSFDSFPDMVLSRTLEGSEKSGAKLSPASAARRAEAFIVYGPVASPKFGYIGADGAGRELASPAALPHVFEVGSHRVKLLKQFAHARAAVRYEKAPYAAERRPALVLQLPGRAEPAILPWKGFEPVSGASGSQLLRFGPEMVRLPFSVKLKDFRKTDYPGTEMAMAYESEVIVSDPVHGEVPYLIHMNTPYAHAPWKVYQSGFIGENITVLSVMRDPGLPLTYLGSITLCVGIFLTFFSRSFSWGHPGIPAPTLLPEREAPRAPISSAPLAHPGAPRAAAAQPAGASV